MKIERDCFVDLEYELRDAEGDVLESSAEGKLMSYLHGRNEIPPKLEAALEGRALGEHVVVTLEPSDAYGEFNPDGIVAVPRSEFPADAEIVPGDWISIEVQSDEGEASGSMEMRVIEIAPEAITLDANHPLAGQKITFDLRVKSVRKASAEEVAERSGSDDDDES